MENLLNSCPTCYEVQLLQCPAIITVNTGAEESFDYIWEITDKFGKKYVGYATSDGDGVLEILTSALPDGLLTENSGTFNLVIRRDSINAEPAVMTFGNYLSYTCVKIEFVAIDTTDAAGGDLPPEQYEELITALTTIE